MVNMAQVSLKIEYELAQKMRELAKENRRSLNAEAVIAFEQYVERVEAKKIAAEVEEGKRKAALQAPDTNVNYDND